MKAIKTDAVITSFRGLSDGALSLTVHTPELTPEQKAEFMRLQNNNLEVLFTPEEYQVDEIKIDKEMGGKSPSQRLRNVLYVWFKKLEENGQVKDDFSLWYRRKMESIIDKIKMKIDEYS